MQVRICDKPLASIVTYILVIISIPRQLLQSNYCMNRRLEADCILWHVEWIDSGIWDSNSSTQQADWRKQMTVCRYLLMAISE